jgi:hypothetical protein
VEWLGIGIFEKEKKGGWVAHGIDTRRREGTRRCKEQGGIQYVTSTLTRKERKTYFNSPSPQMRQQQYLFICHQTWVYARLVFENVQACGEDFSRVKSCDQGVLVHDSAAGRVDDDDTGFHLIELTRREYMMRGGLFADGRVGMSIQWIPPQRGSRRSERGRTYIQRHVQADHIARRQQLFKAHISGPGRQVRIQLVPIVILDLHPQSPFGPFLHFPADATHS